MADEQKDRELAPSSEDQPQKKEHKDQRFANPNAEQAEEGPNAGKSIAKEVRDRQKEQVPSFQQHQKEETEKAIEELDEDSVARQMSPDYSPPGTVRGTEGDNANFRPGKQVDPNEEWDPHGGEEDVGDRDDYEPAKRPE